MYSDIRTILYDATKNHYAVIATSAINMETARGIVSAATDKRAPIIFLLGQNMMRRHANAELMMPIIRTLADNTPVPVAVCLDHGSDPERIMYAFRNGFSSIMVDGSLSVYEENVAMTKMYVDLCHQFGMGIEGELGHVGVAANGDEKDESLYTKVDDAVDFVKRTGVDCLAIAVGTAHGEYPKGFIPHINFERIKEIKAATGGIPLALHGGSGSGDDNIRKAVDAGINKVNVVTDVLNRATAYCREVLGQCSKISFLDVMSGMEDAVRQYVSHWIDLTGSEGKSQDFSFPNHMDSLSRKQGIGVSE